MGKLDKDIEIIQYLQIQFSSSTIVSLRQHGALLYALSGEVLHPNFSEISEALALAGYDCLCLHLLTKRTFFNQTNPRDEAEIRATTSRSLSLSIACSVE
jgi:hypothetical protein